MDATGDIQPAIIIGAGTAGLCAAYGLREAGLGFAIIDRASQVGESWRQRHPRLMMNTYRDLSTLPKARFPQETRAFASRDALIAHMESFVASEKIGVEFDTDVHRIIRRDGFFQVVTSRGDRFARHVIVASGRDRQPVLPKWHGMDSYSGTLIHASAFGDAGDYEGKSVLVVGAGNSGFDILNHLTRVKTGAVWLAVRRAPAILPRRLLGVTVHRLSPALAKLPVPVVDSLLALSQRIAFGDLTRLGFPRETEGGASRLRSEQVALVVDEGAIKAIRQGRISLVPPVRALYGNAVVLADDSRLSPDVVIAATGYTPGLAGVLEGLDVLDARGFPRINGAEQAADAPGLWFIGMRASLLGDIGSAKLQGRAIAKAIASGA
nr:NAD(P)/FAD-dependent oxidoreductase [uncultured Gellertiella sp.]